MAESERPKSGEKLRQPRLADLLSDTLRERIVDGEIPDDAALPAVEVLANEFGVSPPSVREALRILESEGLVTVRRGNVGGAVVHRPTPEPVAFTLGLVLQSNRVPAADLALALIELEPLCAALCARRQDRLDDLVPELRALVEKAEQAVDDLPEFERWSRLFHNEVIAGSGNDSIILVVGALERLWAAQDDAWTRRVHADEESPAADLRLQGIRAHHSIVDAIAAGEPDLAQQLFRFHLEHPDIYRARVDSGRIRAARLR